MDDSLKKEILTWIRNEISITVDKILTDKNRGLYSLAARLVVIYGEVLDIKEKRGFIDSYHKKYVKYTTFRRELKNYSGSR